MKEYLLDAMQIRLAAERSRARQPVDNLTPEREASFRKALQILAEVDMEDANRSATTHTWNRAADNVTDLAEYRRWRGNPTPDGAA